MRRRPTLFLARDNMAAGLSVGNLPQAAADRKPQAPRNHVAWNRWSGGVTVSLTTSCPAIANPPTPRAWPGTPSAAGGPAALFSFLGQNARDGVNGAVAWSLRRV